MVVSITVAWLFLLHHNRHMHSCLGLSDYLVVNWQNVLLVFQFLSKRCNCCFPRWDGGMFSFAVCFLCFDLWSLIGFKRVDRNEFKKFTYWRCNKHLKENFRLDNSKQLMRSKHWLMTLFKYFVAENIEVHAGDYWRHNQSKIIETPNFCRSMNSNFNN